jgi:hypothetical protein
MTYDDGNTTGKARSEKYVVRENTIPILDAYRTNKPTISNVPRIIGPHERAIFVHAI